MSELERLNHLSKQFKDAGVYFNSTPARALLKIGNKVAFERYVKNEKKRLEVFLTELNDQCSVSIQKASEGLHDVKNLIGEGSELAELERRTNALQKSGPITCIYEAKVLLQEELNIRRAAGDIMKSKSEVRLSNPRHAKTSPDYSHAFPSHLPENTHSTEERLYDPRRARSSPKSFSNAFPAHVQEESHRRTSPTIRHREPETPLVTHRTPESPRRASPTLRRPPVGSQREFEKPSIRKTQVPSPIRKSPVRKTLFDEPKKVPLGREEKELLMKSIETLSGKYRVERHILEVYIERVKRPSLDTTLSKVSREKKFYTEFIHEFILFLGRDAHSIGYKKALNAFIATPSSPISKESISVADTNTIVRFAEIVHRGRARTLLGQKASRQVWNVLFYLSGTTQLRAVGKEINAVIPRATGNYKQWLVAHDAIVAHFYSPGNTDSVLKKASKDEKGLTKTERARISKRQPQILSPRQDKKNLGDHRCGDVLFRSPDSKQKCEKGCHSSKERYLIDGGVYARCTKT